MSTEWKYCIECGFKLTRSAKFCSDCGYQQVALENNEGNSQKEGVEETQIDIDDDMIELIDIQQELLNDNEINIEFKSKPFGFRVRESKNSLNAWIVHIDDNNKYTLKSLKIGLFIHRINDIIVDNKPFDEIKRLLLTTNAPISIGFNHNPPIEFNENPLIEHEHHELNYKHISDTVSIQFNSKPLGFVLRGGGHGRNAYIVNINDGNKYIEQGLCEGLYVHSINGTIMDNKPFSDIMKTVTTTKVPIHIVFCHSISTNKEIQIEFMSKPLGFTLKTDQSQRNTMISRINDDNEYITKGLNVGLYITKINDIDCDNKLFGDIRKLIQETDVPLKITFNQHPPINHDSLCCKRTIIFLTISMGVILFGIGMFYLVYGYGVWILCIGIFLGSLGVCFWTLT